MWSVLVLFTGPVRCVFVRVCSAITMIVIDFLFGCWMPTWTFSKDFCLSDELFQHYSNCLCNQNPVENQNLWNVQVRENSTCSETTFFSHPFSFLLLCPCFALSPPTSLVLKCQWRAGRLDLHGCSIPEVMRMSTQQITVWWQSHMLPADQDCSFQSLHKLGLMVFGLFFNSLDSVWERKLNFLTKFCCSLPLNTR